MIFQNTISRQMQQKGVICLIVNRFQLSKAGQRQKQDTKKDSDAHNAKLRLFVGANKLIFEQLGW